MSKSTILMNGENSSDVVDFTTDANINMVSVNDISCAKRLDNFSPKESGQGLLFNSCEFDHIYASNMNENTKSKSVNSEISLLKELLLSHLDLIQQQSEQLVTKDKQISALRQENETLKLRLERMDRRVTLQKQKDLEATLTSSTNNTPSATVTTNSCSSSSVLAVAATASPSSSSFYPSTTATAVPESGEPASSDILPENAGAGSSTTPGLIRKRKRDDAGSTCSAGSKRTNRSASWNGMRERDDSSSAMNSTTPTGSGKFNGRQKKEAHRRRRKRRMKNGDDLKKEQQNNILMTGVQYYTPVGDFDGLFDIADEPKVNGCVLEVPSWRIKSFTSCYTMEGTENLSEDVFERRHARLEVDERRRKRWDVQRIREQRQLEKLRQRERKNNGGDDSEELTSLWPMPEEAEYIQVSDSLPVAAFGLPVPDFKPTYVVGSNDKNLEFSLPWLNADKESLSSRLRSLQTNKRKR